ncbi:MAG: FGGY-family carbohydrate kinase [Bacilli bacterium]|nr:FGGY-family carbohydrate kinase [Bacilli bacterium]
MNNSNDKRYALTIDFGTQSARVSIFDEKGKILAAEKETYAPAYFSKKNGYAEQEPDYYFDCMAKCTKRLAAAHPDLMKGLLGASLTCFRDSAVILDKDKKVIRPCILWLDQRRAKCENPLPGVSRAAFKLVGKSATIQLNRQRTVANWLIENEPENWAKTDKYVSISTYFVYRLTGVLSDSASAYTGHYPLDYKKKQWYAKPETHLQGQCFSVKKHMLCELTPATEKIGEITEASAAETGLPVGLSLFASGSDKSCETLGSGVIDDTLLSISLGTASTLETTTDHYVEPFPFLPEYPSTQPGCFNMDHQIYRGFWMINWFLKEFCGRHDVELIDDEVDLNALNAKLKDVPAGSDGLIVQPYWGSNLDKTEIVGTIIGFSATTTHEHVYRAIIEGIGYELRFAYETFRKKLKHDFKEIRISGGGAQSPEICQIMADILGLNVVSLETNEASSLGAAIVVYLGNKVYASPKEAVAKMVRTAKTFKPNLENKKVYDELYKNVYSELYPSLKKAYRYLFRYENR